MPFDIIFSPEADDHLNDLTARNRRTILDQIAVQLTHEPNVRSRHRKQLRSNPLAGWELRIGDFRAFYDVYVHNAEVAIIAIGVKQHDKVLIAGEEFKL